jgi:hypothetical protein
VRTQGNFSCVTFRRGYGLNFESSSETFCLISSIFLPQMRPGKDPVNQKRLLDSVNVAKILRGSFTLRVVIFINSSAPPIDLRLHRSSFGFALKSEVCQCETGSRERQTVESVSEDCSAG